MRGLFLFAVIRMVFLLIFAAIVLAVIVVARQGLISYFHCPWH